MKRKKLKIFVLVVFSCSSQSRRKATGTGFWALHELQLIQYLKISPENETPKTLRVEFLFLLHHHLSYQF